MGAISRDTFTTTKMIKQLRRIGVKRSPKPKSGDKAEVEIKLNIYDLVERRLNDKLENIGIGIYHSGLELFGREWSFGKGDNLAGESGVFSVVPGTATDDFLYSVKLGKIRISEEQLEWILEGSDRQWTTDTYNIFDRNCNNFTAWLAAALGVTCDVKINFPNRINRAASAARLLPRFFLNWMCLKSGVPPLDPPSGRSSTANSSETASSRSSLSSGSATQNPLIAPSKQAALDLGHVHLDGSLTVVP